MRFPTVAFLAIVLALTLGGCAKEPAAKAKAAEAPKAAPAAGVTLTVSDPASQRFITASGTALPLRDSILAAEVSAKISELAVQRGQEVKRGQVLLRLDAETFRFQAQQAEAGQEAARSATAQLERDFTRMEKLKADGSVAVASYEQLQAQLDRARSQLKQSDAGVALAKRYLANCELRAPYDGTITQVMHEVGEMVTLMPPTALLRLVDTSSLDVQIFLPENEAPFVKVGKKAQVLVESASAAVEGEVIFVSNQIQPGTQTFELRVRIKNPQGRVKAGAFTRLQLERDFPPASHLVPAAALARRADGQTFVRVATANGTREVTVKPGPGVGGPDSGGRES